MTDLPEPDPIRADARRTRRRKLVPENAACRCGETDPDVLEDHHVLGVAGSDAVRAWICKNCHARESAAQQDHGGTDAGNPHGREPLSFLERLARVLRSLGTFCHSLAHALFVHADRLVEHVAWLDARHPGWRAEGWAQ